MEWFSYNILSIIAFLPLFGALVVFLTPEKQARGTAAFFSGATFLVSLLLWVWFEPGRADMQFISRYVWLDELGITYSMGIDGISLMLVLLTTFLTPLVIVGSFSSVGNRVRGYMGLMLALETGMLGAFMALDMFLFYVFWEAMLVPMYLIIGVWGGKRRIYAAVKFFLYTMVGSLLMLVAIFWLYFSFREFSGGVNSAYLLDLYQLELPPDVQLWMFLAFALAFAIKVPMFPLHTWLPDAHVEAPTGGSVILAGVLLKMGTYGFLRFAIPLFPTAAIQMAPALQVLAVIGIIYGALVALVQDDVKKLVAYSSVSHLGFVMLGLFAFNVTGIQGAVYQMLSHGISTGALFMIVGVIYERRHTRAIVDFGGIAKVTPLLAFAFMLVMLSSVGLPGLNGFVGEFLILIGAFEHSPWLTAAATTGVILGAWYMLLMFRRVMFGPVTNEANAKLKDLNAREIAYLTPMLVMIVVMGVYPKPFLDRMEPSVKAVAMRLEQEAERLVAERMEVKGTTLAVSEDTSELER